MGLKSIDIKNEYRTTSSNIIRDFYIPVLSESVLYQRAVGFFSSTALVQLAIGLQHIVENKGKVQLIVSPKLSEEDIKAIAEGYKNKDEVISKSLIDSLSEVVIEGDKKRLAFLTGLIENGILDIKIAFLKQHNQIGMFHEKLGIMTDAKGDFITFSGSLNESLTAYTYNVECVDVYQSWGSEDTRDRAHNKRLAFNRMWSNNENGIDIIEFPKVALDRMIQIKHDYTANNGLIYVEEDKPTWVYKQDDENNQYNIPFVPGNLDIRDYQQSAVDNWSFNEYKGIFDMATGTGKTITGLLALTSLFHQKGRLAVVIIAPYTHLVEQWIKDLKWFNIDPIVGYSDSKYSNYRKDLRKAVVNYNLGIIDFTCFITTNASFRITAVQSLITMMPKDSLIIVDEAHNFGSPRLLTSLPNNFLYRLALSATLDRHNDPVGTAALYKYFGNKSIEYGLQKAIQEEKLSPYKYYPLITSLTPDEYEEYMRLTSEIAKHLKEINGKIIIDDIGKMILLKRARLVAGANNKIELLIDAIRPYKNDDGILIYCGATNMLDDETYEDEIRQIDLISRKLYGELAMRTSQFTASEDRETRQMIIELFVEKQINGIVAIKCLDEGVNIPSIKTAFILASTTNPKEHIQRRGRVLRLSDNKKFAEIFDFIVLPRPLVEAINLTDAEKLPDVGLVKRELKRVNEFSKLSLNETEGQILIARVLDVYKQIKWDSIYEIKEEEIL